MSQNIPHHIPDFKASHYGIQYHISPALMTVTSVYQIRGWHDYMTLFTQIYQVTHRNWDTSGILTCLLTGCPSIQKNSEWDTHTHIHTHTHTHAHAHTYLCYSNGVCIVPYQPHEEHPIRSEVTSHTHTHTHTHTQFELSTNIKVTVCYIMSITIAYHVLYSKNYIKASVSCKMFELWFMWCSSWLISLIYEHSLITYILHTIRYVTIITIKRTNIVLLRCPKSTNINTPDVILAQW